jgi:hypothetical protein
LLSFQDQVPTGIFAAPETQKSNVATQENCHNDPTSFPRIGPGAGAENRGKAGCMMMRFSARLLAVFLSLGLAPSSPQAAQATRAIRISDPSICIDGMETVPDSDENEPILAAADGGCNTPEGPISI